MNSLRSTALASAPFPILTNVYSVAEMELLHVVDLFVLFSAVVLDRVGGLFRERETGFKVLLEASVWCPSLEELGEAAGGALGEMLGEWVSAGVVEEDEPGVADAELGEPESVTSVKAWPPSVDGDRDWSASATIVAGSATVTA